MTLQLIHQFVDSRIPQDAVTLGRVVPTAEVELLEEASHPDRYQCLHERLDAGAPQRQSIGSAINDCTLRVWGASIDSIA